MLGIYTSGLTAYGLKAPTTSEAGISPGAIAGAVIGVFLVLMMLVLFGAWSSNKRRSVKGKLFAVVKLDFSLCYLPGLLPPMWCRRNLFVLTSLKDPCASSGDLLRRCWLKMLFPSNTVLLAKSLQTSLHGVCGFQTWETVMTEGYSKFTKSANLRTCSTMTCCSLVSWPGLL